jgi:hypothetical protein
VKGESEPLIPPSAALSADAASAAPVAGPPKLYKMRWLALFQFCVLCGGSVGQMMTFTLTFKQAAEYFDMTKAEVNFTVTVFASSFIVFMPFIMVLFNKIGQGRMIQLASTINVAGVVLRFVAATQPSFLFVLLSQFMFALTVNYTSSIPALIAATWFGEHERAFATTISTVSSFIGIAIGNLLPPEIITDAHHGRGAWVTLFAAQGGFAVIALILAFVVPDGPPTPPTIAQEVQQTTIVRGMPPRLRSSSSIHSPLNRSRSNSQFKKSKSRESIDGAAACGPDSPTNRRRIAESRCSTIELEASATLSMTQQAKRMFAIPALTCLVINQAFMFGVQYGALALLPQLLQPYGFAESTVGQMGFASTITGAVFSIAGSRLIDSHRRYKEPLVAILVACTVLYGGIVLTMYLELDCAVTLIFVLDTLLGVTQATSLPLSFEYALELCYPYNPLIPVMALMLAGNAISIPLMFGVPVLIGDNPTKRTSLIAMSAPAIVSLCTIALIAVPRGELKRLEYEKACAALETVPAEDDDNRV